MPESGSSNFEVPAQLSEQRGTSRSGAHEVWAVLAAVVLAIVAVATAWSGYQAALWTGHQAELYGVASKLRVEAEGATTVANEERLYNASTVVEWIKAKAGGEDKLAAIFERRILPEFRAAFEAWKKTDPLHNPEAPAGPFFMSEYRSAKTDEAARLNQQATETFEKGNLARKHADDYVQVTVALATVLLLVAISQRFKLHPVRAGLAITATLLLCLPLFRLLTLPRA
jgi:hypothetical protein